MSALPKDSVHIREVWNSNLEAEFLRIRDIVDDYPYVAMDTEFPGFVVSYIVAAGSNHTNDTRYHDMRSNVDILKLIQLGLAFSDENGNLPTCVDDNKYCIWQFNFREFDVDKDPHASASIKMLRESGIDFDRNRKEGVDAIRFAELLIWSGAVFNENVHWITFHGGYDFGYLLKVLRGGQNLPVTQTEFFELVNIFFPLVYDVKHMIQPVNALYGGLAKVAELIKVPRVVGTSHTAASDSLLTLQVFWKLKELKLVGSLENFQGILFNLGAEN